jgi:predicted amidohydrolase
MTKNDKSMTQESLQVAVLQLDLVWENPQANRDKIDLFLQKVSQGTDVVFLPEMFSTGFTLNAAQQAEPIDGSTIQWMKQRSAEHQLAICGSLIIVENGQYFNRLVFVEPNGEMQFYNKRHLFTMDNEESHFVKGQERLIVNYKGWRICPLICYDLRFPVWSRNHNKYDILIYSANWPNARKEVWNTLLKARAIENQAFVVGANRVGVDGNAITYSGNSQLIDSKGNVISTVEDNSEGIIAGEFSFPELMKFRAEFPVLNDADSFLLKRT